MSPLMFMVFLCLGKEEYLCHTALVSYLTETVHLNVYTNVGCGNILDLSFLKMLDPCPWRESRGRAW